MRAISLRVCLSAPETPAPPRWVWSPGPARRTRQPLSTHTARYPPRTRTSTPTNSAWTPSGARWRPSDRGVATRTWTAAGETPDSQKVNTAPSTTDGCRLHTTSPRGFNAEELHAFNLTQLLPTSSVSWCICHGNISGFSHAAKKPSSPWQHYQTLMGRDVLFPQTKQPLTSADLEGTTFDCVHSSHLIVLIPPLMGAFDVLLNKGALFCCCFFTN